MRAILMGIGFAITLMACASFSYKYYAWDYENHILLGHTSTDDLPDTYCRGDSAQKTKCMVVEINEFYRMKGDFETCQSQLSSCQKRCSK